MQWNGGLWNFVLSFNININIQQAIALFVIWVVNYCSLRQKFTLIHVC